MTVIRITNNIIFKQFKEVCEYIDCYVKQKMQSPQSPDGDSLLTAVRNNGGSGTRLH